MKTNQATPVTPAALQLYEPWSSQVYSIESVVRITQTPRHLIGVYCREGLIHPLGPPERDGWYFDGQAIRVLRRIAALRADYDLNLRGLAVVLDLLEERERCAAQELR